MPTPLSSAPDAPAQLPCRADPELFFRNDRASISQAKTMCWQQCPVRAQCLLVALQTRSEGIWGGMTEQERKDFGASAVYTPGSAA